SVGLLGKTLLLPAPQHLYPQPRLPSTREPWLPKTREPWLPRRREPRLVGSPGVPYPSEPRLPESCGSLLSTMTPRSLS
uniref:Uncharacterized protein n=1 Tax=Pelusios castaneus TaxID=367368 RepID=A0A8C8RX98_9SAUR